MTTKITTSRLNCADATVGTPEDFSAKIGYVVKAETTVYGSLCKTVATFADKPLGVIEYSGETTTDDVSDDNYARSTIIASGYAVCVAGGVITPGTHSMVKCHTDGRVVAVTGSETDGFWSVGTIDSLDGGIATAAGDPIRILVEPRWIFITAS